ncbi:serine/threonine-protein phosphatase 7 long form homolog [Nicotiana sylvestris]|uniref:serine/threonine-protein phosphatase 7 long form homolog n=1 Tax=Nicotiana sylvestris TaxID=4096 RepID=UPI00388CAA9A
MQPLRPRRPDNLWEFIGEHPFHAGVVARLQATGFYTIFELGRMQVDWSLITAFVKRWRPETHTFHLPTGEATITLEDVQVLYGLCIDGRAVALPQYIRSMTRAQFLDMMMHFTGYRPQGDAGGSRVALSAIRDHMAFLYPDITGETEDLHIERSMCQASMGPAVDICGFLPLLQVWAWQWIMPLQPPLPTLAPGEAYPFLPLASRWILRRGNYRGTDAHHNLPLIRDVLDMLVDRQFIWTPYSDELVAQLPFYCSDNRMLWSTSIPMIFFDIVEYHATERVLRQFHRPQPIPRDPGWVAIHYQRDDRARLDDIYVGWLEQQVLIWEEHRADRILPAPTFTPEATIHMYASWYRRHTQLIIGNPIHAIGHHHLYQLG